MEQPDEIFTVGGARRSVVYDGLVVVRHPVYHSRNVIEANVREYFNRMLSLVDFFCRQNAREGQDRIPLGEIVLKISRTKMNLNHCGPHRTTRFMGDAVWIPTDALREIVSEYRTNYIIGCFVDEDVTRNEVLHALFVTHPQLADIYKRKLLELAFVTWPEYDEARSTGGLINSRGDLWGSEGDVTADTQVASVIVLSCETALEYLNRKYYQIDEHKGFYSTVSAKKRKDVQKFRDHLESMRQPQFDSRSPSRLHPTSMGGGEDEEEQAPGNAPLLVTSSPETVGADAELLVISASLGSMDLRNTTEATRGTEGESGDQFRRMPERQLPAE